MRPRVCAAIIQDSKILMVRHEHDGRSYWTLPGGGVESGESLEQAVIREVLEETHLRIEVVRFLFEEPYSHGITYCYLAVIDGVGEAKLGSDPEEANLPEQERMLQGVGWHSLENMKGDRQVSKVLALLAEKESQTV